MGRTPSVSDYGGNNYLRGGVSSTRRTANNVGTYHCRDCNTIRYVAPIEWHRAAKPRCLKCGGTLVETQPSEKRRVGSKTERKGKSLLLETSLAAIRSRARCWACGLQFDHGRLMAGHILGNKDCRVEYERDGKILPIGQDASVRRVFVGTAEFSQERRRYKPWFVRALCLVPFEFYLLGRFQTRKAALALVKHINEAIP